MKKILILIDNDSKELSSLKTLIKNAVKEEDIEILDLYCKTFNGEEKTKIIEEIESIISKVTEQNELSFHIIVDACLTDDEHETSTIKNDQNLSGIICLTSISKLLQKTLCRFNLSIMTRFFFKQLPTFSALQNFKDDKSNHFYAVISKPILDDGEIDEGFSCMPQYTTLLPQDRLSARNSESFTNIVLYAFEKENN